MRGTVMELKHAFLILAHKDDYCFRTLIKMLDDNRNDIFIHMDSKNTRYSQFDIESLIKKSHIVHTARTDVSWGDYSQINAEFILMKSAISSKCDYQFFHLISGQDLPINTQDNIHNFFNSNTSKQFIQFDNADFENSFSDRVHCYHPFQKTLGREALKRKPVNKPIRWSINRISRTAQLRFFPINRNIKFEKGANWWSITRDLVNYTLEKEQWVKSHFLHSANGDEVFMQTLVENSEFRNNLYHTAHDNTCESFSRLIDWNRGKPYVFQSDDWAVIKKSNMSFARKFDSKIDQQIITKIYEEYGNFI